MNLGCASWLKRFVKVSIVALVACTSVAEAEPVIDRDQPVRLFPETSAECRWFLDPGAISFGVPLSPHSFSPNVLNEDQGRGYYASYFIVRLLPSPSLSARKPVLHLQSFVTTLLVTDSGRYALALDVWETWETGLEEVEAGMLLFRASP